MALPKKRTKSNHRYPISLKRKIAKSYLSGQASYAVLAEEHGLRDKTVVKEFVRWYRRKLAEDPSFELNQPMDQPKEDLSAQDLALRVQQLEQQLQQAELKIELLETMIDVAEQHFELPIRKKSGTNPSKP